MKRIAVLTAGASLLETYSNEFKSDYDLVFAVNEAGRHFDHDYLCFIDEWIEKELPKFKVPKIGYMTIPERMDRFPLDRVAPLNLYRKKAERLLDAGIDSPWNTGCGYTFPCCLWEVLAEDPEAEVDIYGLDFGGRSVANAKYTDDRWKFELPWVAYAWPKKARVFGNISETYLKWIAQFQPENPFDSVRSKSDFESKFEEDAHPASSSKLPEVNNRSLESSGVARLTRRMTREER